MADYSPMMKQYFSIKEQNPNSILFFRLGDFYEMFFSDAKLASKELELTLTGRDCGQDERAPMCGVPFHSADAYIAKLVNKGYKVAICEQTEDPATTKGIVKREVVRVITPGTVLEGSMLDESKNNFICSTFYSENTVSISFADISTGELYCTDYTAKKKSDVFEFCVDQFSRFMPKEILINSEVFDLKGLDDFIRDKLSALIECMDDYVYQKDFAKDNILKVFDKSAFKSEEVLSHSGVTGSLSALVSYLSDTQKRGMERITSVNYYVEDSHLRLDINARRNLELLETLRNREKKGSLLWVMDKTKTAMGKRLMRSWIEQPLVNPVKIDLRQNATEELYQNRYLLDELLEELADIFDIERIMTRIVYGTANGKELRALCTAFSKFPKIKALLSKVNSKYLNDIASRIDLLEDMCNLIDISIVDDPPFTIREGEIIREGYSEELDVIKSDMNSSVSVTAQIEAREKEKTGIPKLKVSYNRVFGYYIEVTNMYKDLVPAEYIRKQTLTNCERYITEELKIIESRILGAKDKAIHLEGILFEEIRKTVANELIRVQNTAKAIAELDVICSFAFISIKNDYVRPTITMNGNIYIKNGRHPVVENLLSDSRFVPNDSEMDMSENRINVITGPNMAGKSTFMRQVAVIVIMAQMGCFVPASSANIGIVDKIFTRVGASDDLAAGNSTFMIEMTELSDILKNATKDSLIILDEIGRGTSTFDGMSIARAVLEYIYNTKYIGAKTLFATHYHELTDLEKLLPGIKNYNIAVKKRGDDITFLRKIIRGGCDDSYGIQVAKLAGVPEKVIARAKEILLTLEEEGHIKPDKSMKTYEKDEVQITLNTQENDVLAKLKSVDVNTLTPIECMNLLFEISGMMK